MRIFEKVIIIKMSKATDRFANRIEARIRIVLFLTYVNFDINNILSNKSLNLENIDINEIRAHRIQITKLDKIYRKQLLPY